MLEAAHIFVTQKPGCDKWYSWSAARRLCGSPVPLESRYRWIQPDRPKATFLGRPHLTPCRIPVAESSVFLAVRFRGGASEKGLQENPVAGRADALGLCSLACSLSPTTQRRNVSPRICPEQPRCFHFIGNTKCLTAGIFFSCLGSWGAQSQICSWNSEDLWQFNSMHLCPNSLFVL